MLTPFIRYAIRITKRGTQGFLQFFFTHAPASIGGLEPYTEYWVDVAAVSNFRSGPFSRVGNRTAEDGLFLH